MMYNIAIIGCGVAGNSIAHQLVSHPKFNSEFHIDIFDSKELMGRGQPYIEDSGYLLLNIPSDEMTINNNTNGFTDWLKEQNIPVFKYNARKHFGDYTREMLRRIAHDHSNVRLLNGRVSDIIFDEGKNNYEILTESGYDEYDAVFLTVGTPGYSDPYGLEGTESYLQNPYPVNRKLENLDGRIGVIGTGLSAIDCVRYMILERHIDTVYLFSRSGDMPSVRGKRHHMDIRYFTEENIGSYIENDLISLDKIIELFKREMSTHNIDERLFYRHPKSTLEDLKYDIVHTEEVGKLQYLIIAVNSFFSRVFPHLSKTDKDRFMKEIHPLINKNHSPMPFEVAVQLVEWSNSGRVVIVDGMEGVETEEHFIVRTDDESFEIDYLINATGPVDDIVEAESPILANLIDRMLIAPDGMGGLMVDKHHTVISPRYGTLGNMYAIGHLTFGSDYMSNSVNILIENTRILVEGFMKKNGF